MTSLMIILGAVQYFEEAYSCRLIAELAFALLQEQVSGSSSLGWEFVPFVATLDWIGLCSKALPV
eukprot:1402883-Amphidinium_carterae.1